MRNHSRPAGAHAFEGHAPQRRIHVEAFVSPAAHQRACKAGSVRAFHTAAPDPK